MSFELLKRRGHKAELVTSSLIRERFPAWNADRYGNGLLDLEAGYAESGRVVAALIERAKSLGVELREGAKFAALDEGDNRVEGVVLHDGQRIAGDIVLFATGAWTPFLLPHTREFLRATGHPVFHLKPSESGLFARSDFRFSAATLRRRVITVSAQPRRRRESGESWAWARNVAGFERAPRHARGRK
jgi:glycine/D-amino acid oxidase-like deaminating enzyme